MYDILYSTQILCESWDKNHDRKKITKDDLIKDVPEYLENRGGKIISGIKKKIKSGKDTLSSIGNKIPRAAKFLFGKSSDVYRGYAQIKNARDRKRHLEKISKNLPESDIEEYKRETKEGAKKIAKGVGKAALTSAGVVGTVYTIKNAKKIGKGIKKSRDYLLDKYDEYKERKEEKKRKENSPLNKFKKNINKTTNNLQNKWKKLPNGKKVAVAAIPAAILAGGAAAIYAWWKKKHKKENK